MEDTRFKAHFKIEESAPSEDGDLIVEGIASTGDVDREGEIVDQKTLAEAATRAKNVPIFWQHNWDAPIGRVLEMAPSDGKLLVRVAIGKGFEIPVGSTTMPVDSIRSMISQKIVTAFSIGFKGTAEKSADGSPVIKVSDLYEVSVVTIPANANALFNVSKAAQSPYGVDFAFGKQAAPAVTDSRFTLDEPDDEITNRAVESIRSATNGLRQDVGASKLTKELSQCLISIRSQQTSQA